MPHTTKFPRRWRSSAASEPSPAIIENIFRDVVPILHKTAAVQQKTARARVRSQAAPSTLCGTIYTRMGSRISGSLKYLRQKFRGTVSSDASSSVCQSYIAQNRSGRPSCHPRRRATQRRRVCRRLRREFWLRPSVRGLPSMWRKAVDVGLELLIVLILLSGSPENERAGIVRAAPEIQEHVSAELLE